VASGAPFSVPFFPGNMGTDGLGKYLYVTENTNSQEVAAFAIGSSGSLTTVSGSPFAFPLGQVQGDPTGNFLIGIQSSNYGIDDLYVYNITQSGTTAGAISAVSGSPFTTPSLPDTFAVQPDSGGNQVYIFGVNATETAFNPVAGYTLSSSGTLTADTGSPFTGVGDGSWGQFDQSGAFLFVYSSYTNTSDQVVTQITPLTVGSGGALTQPISTLTLATPGFWVVTDPN
jgi:hypothetical protein